MTMVQRQVVWSMSRDQFERVWEALGNYHRALASLDLEVQVWVQEDHRQYMFLIGGCSDELAVVTAAFIDDACAVARDCADRYGPYGRRRFLEVV